jgi:tetratricopeptide (TPR) repeat protein
MYAANRLYNDGLEKANVRDLSGAVLSLRQCLKLNKNHIGARNLLGLVYFERGEVAAALTEWVISKNIRNEKNLADDYINMLQNNPGRLDTYNQAIKKYNQALTYCRQDSLDLAVIQLKKVISLNPKFIQARQLLTLLLINSQDWERAKREIDRLLRIDTSNTTALRYLKEVEAMLPTEEEKVKKKKETLIYQSGNDTVIQPIVKKHSAAFHTVVNIVIGIVLGAGIIWFLAAPARIQSARNESDEKYKLVSEQLDAKTAQVDELTAQVNELTSETQSLSDSLDEALGNNVIIEANNDLIDVALMYMNGTDEVEVAEKLELISSDYLESENATDSFKSLYSAIKAAIGSKVSNACYNTGYEAYQNADYDTAIENLKRAFEYDETNGEALYSLGNSYKRNGNLDEAVETYQKVIELFPGTEKARRSQGYIREIKGE